MLQELSAVATVPDQYPLLVELKCINSLLELLSHDNTDISTKVVHLLQVIETILISIVIYIAKSTEHVQLFTFHCLLSLYFQLSEYFKSFSIHDMRYENAVHTFF